MIGDGVNGAPAMMAVFGYASLWLAIAAYTGATLILAANALRLLRFES
jgi:cation transport ATPase